MVFLSQFTPIILEQIYNIEDWQYFCYKLVEIQSQTQQARRRWNCAKKSFNRKARIHIIYHDQE